MEEKKSWRSSASMLQNGYPWQNAHKNLEPEAPTGVTVKAAAITFGGAIFFFMSFVSPYWLVSYERTYNKFENMGLWEFCFDGFRYPKNQLDTKFFGCNYIFSEEYRVIWQWILPAWFMAVQAFMTIALLAILSAIICLVLIILRIPMKFVMLHEWRMLGFSSISLALTVFCLFISVLVFGCMCYSRDWLLYPNYNYLSWSYAFAVFSGTIFAFAGLMLLYETIEARKRKREKMAMNGEAHSEDPYYPLGNMQYI